MLHYTHMSKNQYKKEKENKMSDNNSGTITLNWEVEIDGKVVKITKKSPPSFYESAAKLMHVLNQKSVSGQKCLEFASNYITGLRKTRKDLPDNAVMVVETKTEKSEKSMTVKVNDYESFVVLADEFDFTSSTFSDESDEIEDDDLNWILDEVTESEVITE